MPTLSLFALQGLPYIMVFGSSVVALLWSPPPPHPVLFTPHIIGCNTRVRISSFATSLHPLVFPSYASPFQSVPLSCMVMTHPCCWVLLRQILHLELGVRLATFAIVVSSS